MTKRGKRKTFPSPAGPPAPVIGARPGGAGTDPRVLLAMTILGLAARLALAVASVGTRDAQTFFKFALELEHSGLIRAYQSDDDLNHPPIPVYWTWAAYRLTSSAETRAFLTRASEDWVRGAQSAVGDPDKPTEADKVFAAALWRFSVVFRLPVILADAVTAWLLYRLWRRRHPPAPLRAPVPGRWSPAAVAAAFAWAPCSILVTGYHCNTDPVYALLCLVAVYLIQDQGLHFWGGLALGAAVNIKLTPVLLIPPLLLSYRRWPEAGRFVAGLAVAAVPFLPLLVLIGPRFYQNALAYNSTLDRWGVQTFLIPFAATQLGPGTLAPRHPALLYYANARYLVFALVLAWAAAGRRLRRWDRYELAAVTFALSLVLTGGFGAQYTVIVLPLLFAVRPAFALAWAAVAGLFIGAVYFVNWTGDLPAYSHFQGLFPWPTPVFGLAAWGMLAWFIARTAWRRSAGVAV